MASVFSNTQFTRRRLFMGLTLALVISSSFIIFAEIEFREYYSHWIIGINAAVAAMLAIFILYRQKHHHGSIEKADLALGIALSLSLCAELVLAIYEIHLEIVTPVPSLADLLSISAYAFLAFYVFSTYLRFYKRFHFSNRPLIIAIAVTGVFLLYIISVTLSLANFSSSRGIAMFLVLLAYPILDAIIIVPSFLIVVNYRKEPLWFTPWVCKSAGIFLLAVADSWFAFFIVTSLTGELWPSAIVVSAHSVIVAAGLLWYMKFLITNKDVDSSNQITIRETSTSYYPRVTPESRRIIGKPVIMRRIRIRSLVFLVVVGLSASALAVIFASSPIWPLSSVSVLVTSDEAAGGEGAVPNSNEKTVRMGALLPLTGVASSTGKSTLAALKLAVEDVNDNFSMNNSSLSFELDVVDTESDPTKSLEKLKLLAEDGIKTIIGPATSAELEAIEDYANSNDIMVVSHSSTAPSLAVEGDNIFRFVPDDTHQAKAISGLMWDDGIRIVIPFWRNDVYGSELLQAVKENFQDMGGQLDMSNETRYAPRTGQLAASLYRINFALWDKDLRNLDSKVQQAISMYGADKVGVYLISLDEVSPIFIQAHSYPALSKVKWYGSDGSVLNEGLVRNHDSAHFAVNTSFYNPIFGIDYQDDNQKLDRVLEEIHKETGVDPSPYSAVAYDALWVIAKAANNTRNNIPITDASNDINIEGDSALSGRLDTSIVDLDNHDTAITKEELVHSANSYQGITGNMTLNRMGDRERAEFDIMAIRYLNDNDETPFVWQKVDSYIGN
jgi:branched-chain amino acid transport system substrate-binding protein